MNTHSTPPNRPAPPPFQDPLRKLGSSILNGLAQAHIAFKWLLLVTAPAIAIGSACAFFLWSLDRVTQARFEHPGLLFFLPLAGLAIGFLYHGFGKSAEGGNNLLIDEIHQPGGGVPRRMAPLILLTTLVTHLFGGSAGREGTAVQMGGSLAGAFARVVRLPAKNTRFLLMAGIAAGFGAVFGTPIAGAIFALEVLAIGRMRYDALIPCLFAAIIGDWTCLAWGTDHTHYRIDFSPSGITPGTLLQWDALLLAKVLLAAAVFGWAGAFFAECSHASTRFFKKICPYAPVRPALGGLILIALVFALGTREYLGLGIWSPHPGDVTISSLFSNAEIHPWSWAWKILFTVITLGCGFKGGEVTPLFFIGAALGNALSGLLGAPTDLFAALGFVAIFAAATKTPLACTIMGLEMFGADHGIYLATACFVAFLCSGHSRIYVAQRLPHPPEPSPK